MTQALAPRARRCARQEQVADSRFQSERVAKQTIKRLSPECLIDLRLDALLETRDTISDGDIQRTRWFGKACLRNDIVYLFQSSAWVFSGTVEDAPWTESDQPDDESPLGGFVEQRSKRSKI